MESERRRSPRVWTSLWIGVDGHDDALHPRGANLSATGVFFEFAEPVGEPGTIVWLFLSSADRVVTLQIMACVVRTVSLPGTALGRGVAFEFMPESDEAVLQLRDFIHYVLALAADGVRAEAARAMPAKGGVHSVVLETDWPLPVGAPVRIEVIARGVDRTTRVEGRAVRVTESTAPGRHRVEIAVQRDVDGPLRRFSQQGIAAVKLKDRVEGPTRRFTPARGIPFAKGAAAHEPPDRDRDDGVSDALEGLLGTLLDLRNQPKPEPRGHLAGDLDRVRLPTLLAVIDMEKMTGELTATRGQTTRVLHFSEGRLLDVTPSEAPREELRALVAWPHGQFTFNMTPVARVDRVGQSTTALLIDLAREEDEARRDRSIS
ncbi:MAG: DUF4388 domain-containing protein [Polyangiaceae bacterium]